MSSYVIEMSILLTLAAALATGRIIVRVRADRRRSSRRPS